MLDSRLKLITLIFSILLITGMSACADNIDTHNFAFKTIIEELQNRITGLENAENGESHLVYPQQWATGDGTVENPWANDCIQKAYDFVPAGGTIYLRTGYYRLAGQLTISKQINIIGEGMNKTIIRTADANGFYTSGTNYISIKNLTIDGDAQTDGTQWWGCIDLNNSDYALLEDIEVMNGGYYGIGLYQSNHCLFQNIYAHDNYRHGVHSGSNAVGRGNYNTYKDIYVYDNGVTGFDDRGTTTGNESTYNIYDNIHAWGNDDYGIGVWYQNGARLINSVARSNGTSGSNLYGMYIAHVKDMNIINCVSISNGSHGINFDNGENINFTNCTFTSNTGNGIFIDGCEDVNFTNVIVKNNSDGITLYNTSNIRLSSCQSYDDRGTPLQDYGLLLTNTNTGISLLNCKLTPNANGDIYNPNGAEIIQWPSIDTDLTQLTVDFNALKTEYEALLLRIKTASEVVNE